MPDFPEIDWSVPPDPEELARLREMAKWPLSAKLDWLDEAQIIVTSLEEARRKREEEKNSAGRTTDE